MMTEGRWDVRGQDNTNKLHICVSSVDSNAQSSRRGSFQRERGILKHLLQKTDQENNRP